MTFTGPYWLPLPVALLYQHGQNLRQRPKYPVVVFVHGGSYQNGMGAMMDGDMMATYDVIVVTFNYRLGALGFLHIQDSPLTGNYGMLDQVEALKWVKANIAHFGGDPERITIDGHSAGGCSVGLLMLSPLSKGLFTSVIEQSGSPFAHWAVNRHQSSPSLYIKMFLTAMGCSGNLTTPLLKRCLQQLPSDIVQEVILNEPEMPMSLIPAFRPVVDSHFLPALPEVLAARGEVTGRNFLTGATLDEGLIAAIPLVKRYKLEGLEGTQKLLALMNCFRGDLPQVHGIVESILEAYAKWPYNMNDEEIKQHFSEIVGDYFILAPTHKAASVMAALNLTVFVYNYEYRSDFDQWEGVMHGAELFYLSGFPLKGHTNFRYDDSDKHMARLLLQLWANFAKNGLPSLVPMQNFHMPRFTLNRRAYTRLFSWERSPSLAVRHDLKPQKMSFWNLRVPLMMERQLQDLLKYPPAGTLLTGRSLFPGSAREGPRSRWSGSSGSGSGLGHSEGGGVAEDRDMDSTVINTQLSGSDVKAGSKGSKDGYLMAQGSGSWILIAACIGLSLLTVLLSVCYCQVRRQVTNLIRQSSVSSGQPML
ncbi:hypothetical protein ACOMHN_003046 [Nucella lapillus]